MSMNILENSRRKIILQNKFCWFFTISSFFQTFAKLFIIVASVQVSPTEFEFWRLWPMGCVEGKLEEQVLGSLSSWMSHMLFNTPILGTWMRNCQLCQPWIRNCMNERATFDTLPCQSVKISPWTMTWWTWNFGDRRSSHQNTAITLSQSLCSHIIIFIFWLVFFSEFLILFNCHHKHEISWL